ncbi:hypothetical protein [Streptomyces narbonensis]
MSDSLREPWLRGLAFNPAAPSDLLIRLVDSAVGPSMCEGRELPDAVTDAALGHPDKGIRSRSPVTGTSTLRGSPPWRRTRSGIVRWWLAGGPLPRPRRVRPLQTASSPPS